MKNEPSLETPIELTREQVKELAQTLYLRFKEEFSKHAFQKISMIDAVSMAKKWLEEQLEAKDLHEDTKNSMAIRLLLLHGSDDKEEEDRNWAKSVLERCIHEGGCEDILKELYEQAKLTNIFPIEHIEEKHVPAPLMTRALLHVDGLHAQISNWLEYLGSKNLPNETSDKLSYGLLAMYLEEFSNSPYYDEESKEMRKNARDVVKTIRLCIPTLMKNGSVKKTQTTNLKRKPE